MPGQEKPKRFTDKLIMAPAWRRQSSTLNAAASIQQTEPREGTRGTRAFRCNSGYLFPERNQALVPGSFSRKFRSIFVTL